MSHPRWPGCSAADLLFFGNAGLRVMLFETPNALFYVALGAKYALMLIAIESIDDFFMLPRMFCGTKLRGAGPGQWKEAVGKER